ncbi:hypothetical protein KSP40_PGU013620 [Platanthera guangdongensis]|uniref:Uncharacterized protein n=1 Tax=Platanthera guangdongensis TaxID=2320717 RepID=A0ABR2LS45_9ASPA
MSCNRHYVTAELAPCESTCGSYCATLQAMKWFCVDGEGLCECLLLINKKAVKWWRGFRVLVFFSLGRERLRRRRRRKIDEFHFVALVPHVSAEASQLSTGLHRLLDRALLRMDAGHLEPAIGSSGTSIPMFPPLAAKQVLLRSVGCRSPVLFDFLHGLPCCWSAERVVPLPLLTIMLILFEAALAADLVFNKHWQEGIPHDATGELRNLLGAAGINVDIFGRTVIFVVGIQPLPSSTSKPRRFSPLRSDASSSLPSPLSQSRAVTNLVLLASSSSVGASRPSSVNPTFA